MATYKNVDSFGMELCKILGFDPKKTMSITIQVNPDDVILVETTSTLSEEEAKEFKALLVKKEFELVRTDKTSELL